MNCKNIEQEGVIEKYLAGGLRPEDQEAFEEHFFACPRCFQELEAWRALQAELAESSASIRAEADEEAKRPVWRWAWVPAVGLAAVLVAFWLLRPTAEAPRPASPPMSRTSPAQAQPQPVTPAGPSLDGLATVQPPPYVPITLRGATDEATQRFRSAMEHYQKGDYRATIAGLRAATELDPKAAHISFYLAVCYLLTGRTEEAIAGLQKTAALGDTPFLEDARFYLAKAFLRKGDVAAATGELEVVVRLQGDRESEARKLLDNLKALRTVQR